MHKQEIIDAVGVGSQFDRDYLYGYHDKAEQYYQETFVSKGSNDAPMERKLLKSGFVDVVPKKENHISDISKMVEDDVEKLAEEEYPIFDGDLLGIAHNQKYSRIDFIKGYNKAKETLYTKQDIIDSVNRMYDIFMDDTLEAKKLRLKGISWHIQNTLESLKQPKKD